MNGYWIIALAMGCITIAFCVYQHYKTQAQAYKNGYVQEPYESNKRSDHGVPYTETELRWVKSKE